MEVEEESRRLRQGAVGARPFQVWRRDGVAEAEPARCDTVNLRPGERVELLIPFRDIASRSLFHCHIAEHGDAGMMGVIEVAA